MAEQSVSDTSSLEKNSEFSPQELIRPMCTWPSENQSGVLPLHYRGATPCTYAYLSINYSNTTQETSYKVQAKQKPELQRIKNSDSFKLSSSQLSSSLMRSHALKFEPYQTFLKSNQEFSLIWPKHSLTAEENIYIATLTLNSLFLPFGPGL